MELTHQFDQVANFTQLSRQNPGARLNWNTHAPPRPLEGCARRRTRPPRSRATLTRKATPALRRPSLMSNGCGVAEPNDVLWPSSVRFQPVPGDAAVGEERDLHRDRSAIRCDAPKRPQQREPELEVPDRACGCPISRSNAGHELAVGRPGSRAASNDADVVAAHEIRIADEEREQPRVATAVDRSGRSACRARRACRTAPA